MLAGIRSRLTYANVVSTLCLFILLGGSVYAASVIRGKDIKPDSITGKPPSTSRSSRASTPPRSADFRCEKINYDVPIDDVVALRAGAQPWRAGDHRRVPEFR